MPLFGYNCKSCNAAFETLVFSSELDKPQPCPQCASLTTEREGVPKAPPALTIKGASAANNYGLKGPSIKPKGRRK